MESNRSFQENNLQFKQLKNKLFSSNMNLIGAKGRNSVVFLQDNN